MKRNLISRLPLDLQIELAENLERKGFTASETAAIQRRIQEELRKRTEQGRRTDLDGTSSKSLEEVDHGTLEAVARLFGESHETARKRLRVVEAAEEAPERYGFLLDQLDSGRMTVNKAFNILRIKERQREAKRRGSPPLPPGVYGVILADPPWRYSHGGSTRGKADVHYPTMPTEEIVALPVREHVAEDAALFLWSTNPFLPDALRVMDAWGFRYVTNICWVKHRFGTGWYVRGQHELLLIGVRGRIGAPADEDRPPSVFHAPRKRHSQKPQEVYGLVQQMYPGRAYLELFARPRHRREGWTYWGLEVTEAAL